MANYSIEIKRYNVTLAQFLRYVNQQCKQKGIDVNIKREEFEKPSKPHFSSYEIIGEKKQCHFAEYRNLDSNNTLEECAQCPTPDEIDGQETELYHWESETSAEGTPHMAEINRVYACDIQTYILKFDGSMHNEICKFTFNSKQRGHGYYCQENHDSK